MRTTVYLDHGGGVLNAVEKYYAYSDARDILKHALRKISDLEDDVVMETLRDNLEWIIDYLEPIYYRQEKIMIWGNDDV